MKNLTQKELELRAELASDLFKDGEITRVECFRIEMDACLGRNTGEIEFSNNKDYAERTM